MEPVERGGTGRGQSGGGPGDPPDVSDDGAKAGGPSPNPKQDTSFVLFIQTHLEHSVAKSTFEVAQKWHVMKATTPERLESPMRVLLFQHLIQQVTQKFEVMVASSSSRSTAVSLGWLNKEETHVNGVRWDPEQHTHIQDQTVPAIPITEVRTALEEITLKCTKPLVIARYHATRKLASDYQSPTLTMLREVGLRVEAADEVWRRLHQLQQLATWVVAGTFVRPETMHRSASGQRIAALVK